MKLVSINFLGSTFLFEPSKVQEFCLEVNKFIFFNCHISISSIFSPLDDDKIQLIKSYTYFLNSILGNLFIHPICTKSVTDYTMFYLYIR